ncbi:MAG: RNHCP domain-containing protein [Patescibacteria group bacterium]|nr:RNHCP domain-containing protein [Patescibacteria group bacterium]MDE1945718.1 RNHCP domain-containing protein [Patescibacteria group bacterium]
MQEKKFKRTVEDFICEHCGAAVKGNGYTNHCPKCLWSKHVDKNPGDRAEKCGGMMRPVRIEQEGGKMMIVHECEKCGFVRRAELRRQDDPAEAIEVAKKADF